MQPHFDVERAQERDSSPVIFGTYAEALTVTRGEAGRGEAGRGDVGRGDVGRGDVGRESELGATGRSGGLRATVTPLPLGSNSVRNATERDPSDDITREIAIPDTVERRAAREGARETLSSSVHLKYDADAETASLQAGALEAGALEAGALEAGAADVAVSERGGQGEQLGQTGGVDVNARSESKVSPCDSRVASAWREWLGALARDPEAALAAAQAYQQLDARGRDEWLSALELDLTSLGVPAVAVYGPLLAVESDPQRVQKKRQGPDRSRQVEPPSVPRRALLGRLPGGVRIGVLVEPLYLGFVQVLACAYVPAQSFVWVRHDPIAVDAQALNAGHELEGAALELVPTRLLVDELARTVVSHRRLGGTLPDALCLFANLFGLDHMVGLADESWSR